jgi:hypothetical protein
MALVPFVGPWPLFSVSWSYTQPIGLLGRGISPSQGLYLYTEQHKHRINTHNTDIYALSGIRIHNLSVGAGEDSSCLRSRGHYDRLLQLYCHKFPLELTGFVQDDSSSGVFFCHTRISGTSVQRWRHSASCKFHLLRLHETHGNILRHVHV